MKNKSIILRLAVALFGSYTQAATVTGDDAAIGVGITLTANQNSSILGGDFNEIYGSLSVIGGGAANLITSGVVGAGILGGEGNYISATNYSTIGGGYQNRAGNINYLITGPGTDGVYGTGDDVLTTLPPSQTLAEHGVIAGGNRNRIDASASSTISGGSYNTVEPWGNHAVISGGLNNRVRYGTRYSVISGGSENSVSRGANWSAINGGQNNHISGVFLATNSIVSTNVVSGNLVVGHRYLVQATGGGYIVHSGNFFHNETFTASSTTYSKVGTNVWVLDSDDWRHWGWIGGGFRNVITNKGGSLYEGAAAAIGGGIENLISGYLGTIGGGWTNGVAGTCAVVPGGSWNRANGINSFAAGRHAHANHDGSFVWGDYHPDWDGTADQDVHSWRSNTFSVRATGGIWLGGAGTVFPFATNKADAFITTSTGAFLSTNGFWSDNSDRRLKENFTSIKPREILKSVASLPINSWSYKGNRTERHIGPVAQDFYSAFSVGSGDTHIAALDSSGIALAAIQGLNEIVADKDEKIRELEARLQKLESVVSSMQ